MVDTTYYLNMPRTYFEYPGSGYLQGVWDRNEILTTCKNIATHRKIGCLTEHVNFESLCLERAQELAGLNKKLWVFWSGGLDSTTAFLALREVCGPNQLGVVYTQGSIEEYPRLWEEDIKGKFETFEFGMHNTWVGVEHACANGIAVTGEIGDQVFGTINYLDTNPEFLLTPWEDWSKEHTAKEDFQRFVAACPTAITTVQDLLWWINYSIKYQWVQMRLLQDNTISKLDDNVFHFFDTDAFNNYAVTVPMSERMPGANILSYKLPMRNVIAKLSGDNDYAFNKPKMPSYMPKYGRYSKYKVACAIDSNWNRHYL